MSNTACLVFSSAPDQAVADALARQLVEAGLVACVKALAPCVSTYRWAGKVERAHEVPLIIVTDQTRCAALMDYLHARHPYEVPEILAVDCQAVLPAYLRWVTDVTAPTV